MAVAVSIPVDLREIPKMRWADMDDSPDKHSSASRVAWADFADSPREAASATACRAAGSNLPDEGEDDRSTQAPSDCGAEVVADRMREIASDDEQVGGAESARAAAALKGEVAEQASVRRSGRKSRGARQNTWRQSEAWSRSSNSASCWQSDLSQQSSSSGKYWDAAAWKQWEAASSQRRAAMADVAAVADGERCNTAISSTTAWKSHAAWNHYTEQSSWADTRSSSSTAAVKKYQCQYTVGIEEERNFRVVRKLLGPHGQHVKAIAEASGTKLRLRGKGSGFLEGPEKAESSDPLMLCISTQPGDLEGYEIAKRSVSELMEDVYRQYNKFCAGLGKRVAPELKITLHEGPREGSH